MIGMPVDAVNVYIEDVAFPKTGESPRLSCSSRANVLGHGWDGCNQDFYR
jgi:hypothetical protein